MSNASPYRFRHELKYIINDGDRLLLKERFAGLITSDKNAGESGRYKIRSLYFDDYFNRAYEEKLMGTMGRSKYRIRFYNDDDSFIRLERKLKVDNYIAKQSAPLTRAETEAIINGEYAFLERRDEALCKEFYFECVTNVMRPRVIVDYDREPYTYYAGDVRLTFDMNVRAGSVAQDVFDAKLPTVSAMHDNTLVMEVKFTELLPRFVKKLLPREKTLYSALSKFIICCDAMECVPILDSKYIN